MSATLTAHTATTAEIKNKPYDIRDSGGRNSIKGLMLRVLPSGRRVYYVQVSRGKREKLGDAPAMTLQQARTKAKSILGKAADGHDFQVERRQKKKAAGAKLGKYLDGGFKEYAQAHIATHKPMIAGLKANFDFLLNKPMGGISELDMARWNRNRMDVSLATRRRELTNLKAVLNRAITDKLITGHQLSHYKVTATLTDKDSAPVVRFLTDQEEEALRKALKGSALEPLVLLALTTGLRRGDLFDLTWSQIDLDRGQLSLTPNKTSHSLRKAGKPPRVWKLSLTGEALRILEALKGKSDSELVFPSPRTGGRLNNTKKGFAAVLEKAKIENFRFHDLRHTFASRLVMNGTDLNTVREFMTHTDPKMTLVYAHLSPDHKAQASQGVFK